MDTFFKAKSGKLYFGTQHEGKFSGAQIRDGKLYGRVLFNMGGTAVGWIVGKELGHWSGMEIPKDRLVRLSGEGGLCVSVSQFLSKHTS